MEDLGIYTVVLKEFHAKFTSLEFGKKAFEKQLINLFFQDKKITSKTNLFHDNLDVKVFYQKIAQKRMQKSYLAVPGCNEFHGSLQKINLSEKLRSTKKEKNYRIKRFFWPLPEK